MNNSLNPEKHTISRPYIDLPPAVWRYGLIGVVILAALMRLIDLGAKSLWFDEVYTSLDAFERFYLLRRTHSLYYLLVRFSLEAGGMSDYFLRLPSALFGVMGVAVMYFMTREIFDDCRVALMASLFTCLSSTHLNHSQEARYYAAVFFGAAFTLYLLARFYRRGSFLSLAAMPIVCFLHYLIHPISLVISGIAVVWGIAGLAVTATGRRHLVNGLRWIRHLFVLDSDKKPAKKRQRRKQVPKANLLQHKWVRWLILGALACCAIAVLYATWRLSSMIWSRVRQVKWFTNPVSGAESSLDFYFIGHFLPFSIGRDTLIDRGNPIHVYLILFNILLMGVGYVRALICKSFFATLHIVAVIASFVLLFSVGYQVAYSYKYLIFLFPLHIAFMMYGLMGLVDGAARLMSKQNVRWSAGAAAAMLILFWAPKLVKDTSVLIAYYKGERSDSKSAIKTALESFDPAQDYLAAYGVTARVLKYYAQLSDIPLDRVIDIVEEKSDGAYTIARLRKAAAQNGDVWFLYAWQWDTKSAIIDWVRQRFDVAATFPSFRGPEHTVELLRWNYTGRVVNAYDSNSIEFPILKDADVEPLSSVDGLPEGSFYTYMHREYRLTLKPPADFKAGSGELILNWESGDPVAFDLAGESLTLDTTLPAGANRVWGQLSIENGANLKRDALWSLTVAPADPSLIEYEGAAFDTINPNTDYKGRQINGGFALILPYNNVAGYNVDAPENGRYQIGVLGTHDAPGPIVLQVSVDGRPAGLLSFSRADQSLELMQFPVYLSSGSHHLQFAFITDRFSGRTLPEDVDNDAELLRIRVQRVLPGQSVVDNRVFFPDDQIVLLEDYISWPPVLQESQAGAWTLQGYDSPALQSIDVGDQSVPAFTGLMRYEESNGQAMSSPFPLSPGDLLYFSVKVRTQQMENHVANVLVAFVDDSGNLIGQQWVNGQGVWDSTEEVQITALVGAPPDTAYGLIGLYAYSRGSKLRATTGQVWFYDFQTGRQMMNAMRQIPQAAGDLPNL